LATATAASTPSAAALVLVVLLLTLPEAVEVDAGRSWERIRDGLHCTATGLDRCAPDTEPDATTRKGASGPGVPVDTALM